MQEGPGMILIERIQILPSKLAKIAPKDKPQEGLNYAYIKLEFTNSILWVS